MLSASGKRVISSALRDHTLYAPGVLALKDVVTNYTSLTASHKWILASVMLLAFRPALVNVESMVSAQKIAF